MTARFALAALAVFAVGCDRQPAAPAAEGGPQLDAPAPDAEPARVYAAVNDAARAKAAELTVSVTQRLPDANDLDVQEILSLSGAGGFTVQAQITGAMSPATQVQGQTLRALLDIAVEEPQVLVYRVTEAAGPNLCTEASAAYVVMWEPSGPGEAAMKLLGVSGGAPGAGDARACAMLEYRRS